jgi:MFS family permease
MPSAVSQVKTPFLGKEFIFASIGYFFVFFSISVFYLFPLYLDRFHPSKSRVGLIMGIHSVTAIMVRPLVGRILDKRGGRKGALIGLLLMIAVMPGFYMIQSAGILALALRALNGIGWGIATTAILAICSELAPPDRIAHYLGVIGAAGIVSQAAGPTVAEEVMRRYGFDAVFHTSLIMLVAAVLSIAAIKERRLTNIRTKIDLRSLSSYPFLILLIIAVMPIAHGAARGTVLNFIALFGASVGFARVGPFFLAFSAAAVLTRLGLGGISDRYGRKRTILPAALLIGINLFWIAGAHSFWGFVLSGFVAGFGQGLIFPALSTYIIDFLGRGNKGLALGLYLSLFDVGMGLGSPLFGWISDRAGYRQMYFAAGCLVIILTALFTFKAPEIPASVEEHQQDSPQVIEQ